MNVEDCGELAATVCGEPRSVRMESVRSGRKLTHVNSYMTNFLVIRQSNVVT